MFKFAGIVLLAAGLLFTTQFKAYAGEKPKKGTYAGCLADVKKKGSSPARAAEWCTKHGYN
jgi:hypothetical protein